MIQRFVILILVQGSFSSFFEAKTLAASLKESSSKNLAAKDPFENVQVITLEMLEDVLRPALEAEITEDFKFELSRHPFPLEVLADEPVQLEVQELKINDKKTRFTFKILFKDFDAPPFTLSGNLIALVKVPTLNRTLKPQESIAEADLTWTSIPARLVNRSTITTPEQLVGAEPRHGSLSPDTPLRINDIKRAKAVKRGDMITAVLKSEAINIDMKAQAKEEGEIGQMIKIINLQSNKVIQGKITAPHTVEIFSPSPGTFQEITP